MSRSSLRRSFKVALFLVGAAAFAGACSHDWDSLDPRLAVDDSSGAGATSSVAAHGASSTDTSTGSSASTVSGAGGMGGGGSQAQNSSASTLSSSSGGGSAVTTGSSSGGGGNTTTTSSGTTTTTTTSSGSATGGGGSGGGTPVHCGGTNMLSYDFMDPHDPTQIFSLNPGNNALPAQMGGEGVITLPSAQIASSFGSFSTLRRYDLHGDRVFVKVTAVPDTASTAAAALELISSTNADYLGIQETMNTLHFAEYLGGVYTEAGSAAYDPATDIYWAISEDGMGTIHWETSTDGVTFKTRASKPTASLTFSLSSVGVQVSAQTMGSEVSPGSAHFTALNGGAPPTANWCPSSSFSDNFDDGVTDPKWGRKFADANVSVAESGGMLEVSLSSTVIGYGAYMSNVSFDMLNDAIVVQVTATPNASTSAQAYLRAETDAKNGVDILVQQGSVSFRQQVADTIMPLKAVQFSTMTNWLRIREKGGMTFWEASPDGKTWTTYAMEADVIDMSRVDVRIGAGAYESVTAPGTAKFDNYNLPPP